MGPKQKFSVTVTDVTILKVDEGDVKGGCENPPTNVAAQTCVFACSVGSAGRCSACEAAD